MPRPARGCSLSRLTRRCQRGDLPVGELAGSVVATCLGSATMSPMATIMVMAPTIRPRTKLRRPAVSRLTRRCRRAHSRAVVPMTRGHDGLARCLAGVPARSAAWLRRHPRVQAHRAWRPRSHRAQAPRAWLRRSACGLRLSAMPGLAWWPYRASPGWPCRASLGSRLGIRLVVLVRPNPRCRDSARPSEAPPPTSKAESGL